MQSVVAEGRAFIRNADGRPELYDIVKDPAEIHDLAGSADAADLVQLGNTVKSLFEAPPPR